MVPGSLGFRDFPSFGACFLRTFRRSMGQAPVMHCHAGRVSVHLNRQFPWPWLGRLSPEPSRELPGRLPILLPHPYLLHAGFLAHGTSHFSPISSTPPKDCAWSVIDLAVRPVADEHYKMCMLAGVKISGINAEVMPGQWLGQRSGDQISALLLKGSGPSNTR